MKPWTRWQDWTNLVAGLYLALAPIWTAGDTGAATTLIVLGALIVCTALWALIQPASAASQWTNVTWAVLLIIAPWAISYTGLGGAAWTSWIGGIVVACLALWALPAAKSAAGSTAVSTRR
ncbi:SPW repeat protein [Nonomuraea sp. FMUSA5-5]|uniref:SPW repeat protein n=1 Tax=Nonomuraea composti TaxID=2720023 RepID=A0ABX1BI57_9ACTN|nr:SPW repeat protein [Nonomuraea sp. FMUSA5-5]NJP96012.1 SPW repeat protein [Nonomuraea sp. FMUSA5-5]